MRGAFYFIDKNKGIEEYLEKVFKAYWTEGKDISSDDCLNEIVTSLSVQAEDFLEFIALPETKERLVKNTQELMDRKGFGSPTFFLDKEDMYFGNDRIQLIEKKI
jgi:2-hydroxychromene-2-carboxylate isomerase